MGLDVDHNVIDKTWFADQALIKAFEARDLGEAYDLELTLNGQTWEFTETIVSGWRLLKRAVPKSPDGMSQGYYMLIGEEHGHATLDLIGQAPCLTPQNDLPLDSAGKEISSPKHNKAMEVLIAIMIMDFILRRLPD